MDSYPHIVVARRDHDFRVVHDSAWFPSGTALKDEARWLALDWWGNCFVERFRGAIGHFCSTVEQDVFLLMLVLPGPVAPDRFVVCLKEAEYGRHGFSPFRAIHGGVFDFVHTFYAARNESTYHVAWPERFLLPTTRVISEAQQQRYDIAERYLMQGTSIVVLTREDTNELALEFQMFIHALAPEILRTINICTFTNSSRELLEHFGTITCGWYNATRDETLNAVLEELVPLDANGSPFKTIRRADN